MSLEVNINQNSANAVPTIFNDNGDAQYMLASNNNCHSEATSGADGNCANSCQMAYATLQANRILEEWGIHYTPDASQYYEDDWLRSIPFNLVRNPSSEWHITCQDLEGILSVSATKYSNAQDRLDGCPQTSGYEGLFCDCNANIDKEKWRLIFNWAEEAVQYQSSTNDIDTCIVEAFEDSNLEITQQIEDMLNDKEGMGLTSNTLMAIVGGATLITIGLILKFVK